MFESRSIFGTDRSGWSAGQRRRAESVPQVASSQLVSNIVEGCLILTAIEDERPNMSDPVFLLKLIRLVLSTGRTVMTEIAPDHLISFTLDSYADPTAPLVEAFTTEIEPDTVRKELPRELALQSTNLVLGGAEGQFAASQQSDVVLLQVIRLEHQLPKELTIHEKVKTTARVRAQTELIHAETSTFICLLRTSGTAGEAF